MPGDLAGEIRRALDEHTPAVIAARDEAGVIFIIDSVEAETHTDGEDRRPCGSAATATDRRGGTPTPPGWRRPVTSRTQPVSDPAQPRNPRKEPTPVIYTILAVIALLIAAGFIIGGRDAGSRALGILIALVSISVLFFASFTIVKPAEVGVPITFGHLGDPVQPGAHMLAPWTKVETYPTRPLTTNDITVTARTKQAGQIKVTVAARWHVDPERAADLYKQVRTGDEEKISASVVDKNLAQAVGTVFNGLDNGPAVNERATATNGIRVELAGLLNSYGIALDDVFVRAAEPDERTADSLARLAAQDRETLIATERQNTAAAEAKARKIEADGLKTAIEALPKDLTPEQVAAMCLQAWERVARAGIAAGVPVYTTCDGASVTPVAPVTGGRE